MTKKKTISIGSTLSKAVAAVVPDASSIDLIRKAICDNRGGLDFAEDEQIMTLWRALPKALQDEYLKATSQDGKTDDDRK